jgi:hypothetical protein
MLPDLFQILDRFKRQTIQLSFYHSVFFDNIGTASVMYNMGKTDLITGQLRQSNHSPKIGGYPSKLEALHIHTGPICKVIDILTVIVASSNKK